MTGLFVFTNDCRLQDNTLLNRAASECDELVLLYCLDSQLIENNHFGLASIGPARLHFLRQTLEDLDTQLEQYEQKLILKTGKPLECIQQLCADYTIERIYIADQAGPYEQRLINALKQSAIPVFSSNSATLYQTHGITQLASFEQFTPFRKWVEHELHVAAPDNFIDCLPPPPAALAFETEDQWPDWCHNSDQQFMFQGGELAALAHLYDYLSPNGGVRHYKQTRNHMGNYQHSSMLSCWLAPGSISPRYIWREVLLHEQRYGQNDSTYWLRFELLWREFFYWQLKRHQEAFFRFEGIRNRRPLQSFYPAYFQAWCAGNTGIPLVDANMRELASTGYLSNRGRQIVASYLVNDMQIDWRYGAAWFESQLVDYDVASNWGNWMYLAGVGHDPRSQRYFNLKKQAEHYDNDTHYICHWFPELNHLPAEDRHFPYIKHKQFKQPVCTDPSLSQENYYGPAYSQ